MLTAVTGAGGFVGHALARRMNAVAYPGQVRLIDKVASDPPGGAFESVAADLSNRAELRDALEGADVVIHLAALPGGVSEADPVASRHINLEASLNLIELIGSRSRPARLVYASSIAVLGPPFPTTVSDDTKARPATTYGAHKLMVEVAMADAMRRGLIDGVTMRLPAVVARPSGADGLKSAFLSNLFHALADGRSIVLPVGPQATAWLISARACADALIHGATRSRSAAPLPALNLPAARATMCELAASIARVAGHPECLVRYQPDRHLEEHFGSLPDLRTPLAEALGFRSDGDLEAMVVTVLDDLGGAMGRPAPARSAGG